MKCAKCEASGCKLWREYQTFDPKILCVICAGKDQEKDVSQMDAEGYRPLEDFIINGIPIDLHQKTDQIGWYVPCIPDGEGNFWGYTSVPDDLVAWWRKLPTFPVTN